LLRDARIPVARPRDECTPTVKRLHVNARDSVVFPGNQRAV